MEPLPAFSPPVWLRNALVQTVLASSGLRARGENPMAAAANKVIVDAGRGVRLLGFHSPQPKGKSSRGLVVLLHGWQGSADSSYVLAAGRRLYAGGFDVFRLNLRDHGESHHLNEGLFYATLLDEVFYAVRQVSRLARNAPAFLAGFSLGGNFALRIARRCTQEPIKGLRHVAAISPVLNPEKVTDRIDGHPLLRRYFLRKWRKSLARKQRLFPERYDFRDILQLPTLRRMTERLLDRYSPYGSCRAYFLEYTLLGDALRSVEIPTTVITAQDDPIIPVEDFQRLESGPAVRLFIHRYGGHNGFVETLRSSWCDRALASLFRRTGEVG